MMNKSKVRQSALSLIYAVLENGGDTTVFDFDLFWDIAQEKECDHYAMAEAKAVAHTCRNLPDAARVAASRVQAVRDALEGDLTAAKLREDTERYAGQLTQLVAAQRAQQLCLADKRRDGTAQLALCNKDVIRLAYAVEGLGRALLPTFADYPAYRAVLDPFAAAVRRCGRLLAPCAALDNPASLEGAGEFAALVRSAEVLQALRTAAEELALAVLGRRAEYDGRIAAKLDNYSPDRLDMVDKCILYLALHEMEVNGLDMPIVVSEATALADAYSGSKSAPFIHGVIAALARKD